MALPKDSFSRRTRSQTIYDLDKEPPKSLGVVRFIISQAVREIEQAIMQLENDFYGNNKPEVELFRYVPTINVIMTEFGAAELSTIHQINKMVDKFVSPPVLVKSSSELSGSDIQSEDEESTTASQRPETVQQVRYDVSREQIEFLQECTSRITAYIPGAFSKIIEEVLRIEQCMKKYFLSYAPTVTKNKYLETVYDYEQETMQYSKSVQDNIKHVTKLTTVFNGKGKGLKLSMFHMDVIDIGRKAKCLPMPFLLMFPQACFNIRCACRQVKSWLGAEECYATFIKNDIVELQSQKIEQLKLVRDATQQLAQSLHKTKSIERNIVEVENDLRLLRPKEQRLSKSHEKQLDKLKDTKLQIEVRISKRNALKKRVLDDMSRERFGELYDRLTSDLWKLTEKLPSLTLSFEIVSSKLSIIEKKHKRVGDLSNQLSESKGNNDRLAQELRTLENEQSLLDDCLEKLKEIYLFKTSPDAPRKIFQDIPMRSKALGIQNTPCLKDNLDRAILLVAKNIDRSWMQLYRCLPFNPQRGLETFDLDVNAILNDNIRDNDVDRARKSLVRWRRLHMQASVQSLKEALAQIKRPDIVALLERREKKLGNNNNMTVKLAEIDSFKTRAYIFGVLLPRLPAFK